MYMNMYVYVKPRNLETGFLIRALQEQVGIVVAEAFIPKCCDSTVTRECCDSTMTRQ